MKLDSLHIITLLDFPDQGDPVVFTLVHRFGYGIERPVSICADLIEVLF